MATMILRGDVLRAEHIEGDPEIARRIRALPPGELLILRIDGRPLRFRRMRDAGGRPTEALAAEPGSAADWRSLLSQHGGRVSVDLEDGPAVDPYLLSLSVTLQEWNSPEDVAAYDGL